MESPHIKYELSFEEYQNLIEQFSNLVKTKDFKPLDYKDYRRIAGKHLNGIVSKVIIEFVDESHFIITFHPTKETIYAGNIFDLSFGTFINYFNFEEEPKETMEKNNTYDIWGNGISNDINNTSNTTDSISYQTTTFCPDYTRTNQIATDSNSSGVFTYDTATKPWYIEESLVPRIDDIEEKVRINGVKIKEDILNKYLNDEQKSLVRIDYQALKKINCKTLILPIKAGDIIIEDIEETGANIIAAGTFL